MSPAFSRSLLLTILILVAPGSPAFDLPDAARHKTLPATGTIQLAFAPEDNATGLIVQAIANARKQILVQAFSFTNREIAAALVRAKQRGVDVQLIADLEQMEKIARNRIGEIAAAGVPVYLDSDHSAAHNKVMVIDPGTPGAALITGSFNFTYAAQHHNAENLLVFRGNPPLAEAYAANWQRHRSHALPFRPKHAW